MRAGLDLTIADLSLAVRGPEGLPIAEDEPAYQEFLTDPAAAAEDRVTVTVRLDPPPDATDLPVRFDSGTAWRLRGGDGERVLEWPAREGPEGWWWSAYLTGWAEAVTVHCPAEQVRTQADGHSLRNPVRYPLDQLLLMYRLAARGGLIVHAASVALDGAGLAFAGPSGAGKSTLAAQIQGAPGVEPITDDRTILRLRGDGVRLWGTPWPGEGQIARNRDAPLDALCVLRQGPTHRLRRLVRPEALARLLPVISIPWFEPAVTDAALAVLAEVLARVPVLELEFTPDRGVVDVLRERPWSPS